MPSTDTTEVPEQQPIVIDSSSTPPISPVIADQRAFKAKFGMASLDMTLEDVSRNIQAGNEDQVRERAAKQQDYLKALQAEKLISDFATKKEGPLNSGEVKFVRGAVEALSHPTDPKSAFEEYYAQEYMNLVPQTAARNADSHLAEAMQQIPEEANDFKRLGSTLAAYHEYAVTHLQNAQAEVESQSTVGWIADQAKGLVPGYTDVKMRGLTGDTSRFSGLLGQNLYEQAQELSRSPDFKTYKTKFDAIMTGLKKDNPSLAVMFAQAVAGQSISEENWNNMTTLLDLSTIKPLGIAKSVTGLAGKAAMRQEVSNTVKGMVKALEDPALDRAGMHEAVGDLKEATVAKATQNFIEDVKGTSDVTKRGLESLHSYFDAVITKFKSNTNGLDRELVNRVSENIDTIRTDLVDKIQNTMRVERLPAVFAVEKNVRAILDDIKTKYPGLNNSILDIKPPQKEQLSGGWTVDVHFGQSDGTLFSSKNAAKKFIDQAGLTGTIESKEAGVVGVTKTFEVQKGMGYYVKVSRGITETDSVVRDALLATSQTKTPTSWLNAWGGWLGAARTPEETLSLEQLMNRKVATYAPSSLQKVVKDNAQEVNKLKAWSWVPWSPQKKKWDDWNRVVAESRDNWRDPLTGEKRMFDNGNELSHFYQNMLHRAPDEQEIAAYFQYKSHQDVLDVLRNNAAYRNKFRIGAETHEFKVFDPAKETPKTQGYAIKQVDGVRLADATEMGNDSVLFLGKTLGEEKLLDSARFSRASNWFKKLTKDVAEGRKVLVRITNPEDRPFQDFGTKVADTRVRYVISDSMDTKPLSWSQTLGKPRPADYDFDHYIKQAKMRFDSVTKRNWYEGDTTVAAFNIRAMGTEVAKGLEQVRLLLKDNKVAEAKAANPLPMNFDEVQKWFTPQNVNGKVVPARLSLEDPIHVVPRNKMVRDMSSDLKDRYKEFYDGSTQGYGRYIENKTDVDEIFTFENKGTKANPLYNVTPARQIDPITSVNRALNRVIEQTFLDDYKIFSVEHWIQEAKPFLSASKEEIAANPFYHFFNPRWMGGADLTSVNNLKTAQFQIRQFLGISDPTSTSIQDTTQKLIDSIYNKTGSSALALAPTYIIPTLRDPASTIRALTFHAKLGLFNPAQLLTQAQTFATIFGVAGAKFAAPGTKAAMLHMWAGVNGTPEIVAKMDQLATKQIIPGTSRWLPGEWTEARELLNNSGFGNVAGEYAARDNFLSFNVIDSAKHKFLNAGAFFFTEGERNVRNGAFYTAYREFRDVHPTGRVTDADARGILQRADLLNVNMSRASNSKIQEGIFSIPTQFLTYQLRTAELMLGKRLTDKERFRMFTTYATLYGVPSAFGLSGLPVGDAINSWALQNGYVRGEQNASGYISDAIANGLPSMIMALSTGNWYNIGEKYGVQGFELLRESMQSDKGLLDIVGGAAYSTLAGVIEGTSTVRKIVGNLFRDEESQFKVKPDHFAEMFREISSFNSAWKLYAALSTGKMISKKDTYLGDTTPVNAIFQYLSGLQPQDVSDANKMIMNEKDIKDYQKYIEQKFIREWRRGLQAAADGNHTQATDYFTNAKAWLQIGDTPLEKYGDMISIANKDYESLVDRVDTSAYLKDTPQSKKETLFNAFETKQKLKLQGVR